MYLDQDVPLLEMSLDVRKTNAEHFALGGLLGRSRSRGILFLGCGNVIHNLSDISFDEKEKPFAWAVDSEAFSWRGPAPYVFAAVPEGCRMAGDAYP